MDRQGSVLSTLSDYDLLDPTQDDHDEDDGLASEWADVEK